MKPVDFEYSNDMIGSEIPVNRSYGILLSSWQASWRERLQMLFTGRIWIAVKGNAMPPTLVSGDTMLTFEIENP